MAIDILSARMSLEQLIQGLSTGSGVSMGTKELIVYVHDYNAEKEIKNIIGDSYQGFGIRYILSGKIITFQ